MDKIICTIFFSLLIDFWAVDAQKNLVIVGGGLKDDNAQIYGRVIELAGGIGEARMGIITAANGDPIDSAQFYTDIFLNYGASEAYWIPVHEGNLSANMDPEVVQNIERMTGFFFGGGDQRRIVNSFYNEGRVESDALAAIRANYESGAVIGGTSAGAAAMPTAVMVTGGSSYDALLNGAFANEGPGNDDLTYDPLGGCGFIDNFVVDSHFSERGREGRIIRLVSDTSTLPAPFGAPRGFGVDEDTALVVLNVDTPEAVAEVIGSAGVFFCDATDAEADTESPSWSVVNVRTAYLTEGDVMQLSSGEVTVADWKSPLIGQESGSKAHISNDIFNGNLDYPLRLPEFPYTAGVLLDSKYSMLTYGLTYELTPRFRVWMVQDDNTTGHLGTNPRTSVDCLTFTHLLVHIEENQVVP